MAYSDLLEQETVTSNYLAVLKPKRVVTGWTVFSGNVYQASFDYIGEVSRVWFNGDELTQGANTTLSAGEFYYDFDAKTLYARLNPSADPDTGYLVAEFEIYCGTIDAHWFRSPKDDTTRIVYFEPIINRSPVFKKSSTDYLFGYNPIQTSSISLINAEHIFEKLLYDSSFINSKIEVYHWLDDLDVNNIQKVLSGFIKNPNLEGSILTLTVIDGNDILSNEYRHYASNFNYYDTTEFPSLDPQYIKKPIRRVFGYLEKFTPVNIDYVDDSPTTSDNREWVVTSGQDGLGDLTKTVSASPSSTTTRTYINSVTGLQVGDTVLLDKATDESTIITAIGANYIDHNAVSVAASSGDTLKRAFVSRVTIIQDNVEYTAIYGRDYTVSNLMAGDSSGFIFSTSLESNLSIPNTLSPSDIVVCNVYGRTNYLTLGGPSFGSNDTRTESMAHPVVITLDLLKNYLGFTDSDIDQTSFTDALADVSSGIGFSVPSEGVNNSFPKYKDIIGDISKSGLFKLLLSTDGKWSITVTKPIGAIDKTIQDDEILDKSLGFSYNFDDIYSDYIIEYRKKELNDKLSPQESYSTVSTTSEIAIYLHGISKTKSDKSIWIFESEAQEYCNRLSFIFGDRRNTTDLKTKNRFFNSELGDVIEVDRVSQPGFDYDGSTLHSRASKVISLEKSKQTITITLDDQKGIQDNSGGW